MITVQCRGHVWQGAQHRVPPRWSKVPLRTTSADGTVRQWDSETGREAVAPYERHIGDVVTAVYSPDGLWIASAGTDRTIRVWEAANRNDVAVLHGHTGVVTDLAFTADGRRLASTSQSGRQEFTCDGTVRIWEVTRNADAFVLRGHTSYIYPVAYSPDGQWIASGGWDKIVRLWDAATGESCAIFRHSGEVRALAFSPDSSWLISACEAEEALRIWNVATGQLQKTFKRPGSTCCYGRCREPRRGPVRGSGRGWNREDRGNRDRRGSPLLPDGHGRSQTIAGL